jgi:signal transduction histidine kinase
MVAVRWRGVGRVLVAVTVATSVVYLVLEYPHGPVLLALSVVMYSVANRLPVGGSLVACGVALVAVVLPELLVIDRERLATETPLLLAVLSGLLLPSWAIGTVVRLAHEAEQRVRQEETRRRADEERLRIAREVHDVVGHGLAVINLQAGVALHVVGRRPEQAEVALAAIKRSSKEALEELRRTLAVFRRPDHQDGPARPAPGLDQLEALAAAMAVGGLPVQVVVTGERARLPAAVDLAVRTDADSRQASAQGGAAHPAPVPGAPVGDPHDRGKGQCLPRHLDRAARRLRQSRYSRRPLRRRRAYRDDLT